MAAIAEHADAFVLPPHQGFQGDIAASSLLLLIQIKLTPRSGANNGAINRQEKYMKVDSHSLIKEFPAFREKIHSLKLSSSHFQKLFDEYDEVDKEISHLETEDSPVSDEHMEQLKKRRLHLKDELYAMLQKR
jgi:uncharacterized protein YdcH (DUF465 family)